MLLLSFIPFAALAGCILAKSTLNADEQPHSRDKSVVSRDDVQRLALYSQYARSTYCNMGTPVGDLVGCEINCEKVEADQARIIGTYLGSVTEIGAYMAVVESRKQIVFAARGSSNDANWRANCNHTVIPFDLVEDGMVHGGFYQAWADISDEVSRTLLKAVEQYPDYDVVATGHSLGGAVATIAAAYFRDAGHNVDLYTYGAPRIGNAEFSDFITNQEGALYRVTHKNEPVPRMPSALIPGLGGEYKYRHISPEYWLTGDPEDPTEWPVEDVKVCEGNLNFDCNDNSSPDGPWSDHRNYLGSMDCLLNSVQMPGRSSGGVYIPQSIREGRTCVAEEDDNSEDYPAHINGTDGLGEPPCRRKDVMKC